MPSSVCIRARQTHLVVFLRHTGCPFAEALVRDAHKWCALQPGVVLILVTHGDSEAAEQWFSAMNLPRNFIHLHDAQREEYGRWGVGYAGWKSLLHPAMLTKLLALLGRGIRNRSASGTRWQKQAVFLVNGRRRIQWCHVAAHAGDLPDLPMAGSEGS